MAKILLAEDDAALNHLVCTLLEDAGHEVVACKDGGAALEEFHRQSFDLLITDIMMPVLDGYQLAAEVRREGATPILFLTALLLLRVAALLRRANIADSRTITVGNLTMDKEEHTAYVDGEELPLTVREFDLLFKLLSYPRRTFTRTKLMDEFWDFDSSATSRTVDVYMSKLREKTAHCTGFEIVTVHGLGYKLVLK